MKTTKTKGAGLVLPIRELLNDAILFKLVKPTLHLNGVMAKMNSGKLEKAHLPLKDDGGTHAIDMDGWS